MRTDMLKSGEFKRFASSLKLF